MSWMWGRAASGCTSAGLWREEDNGPLTDVKVKQQQQNPDQSNRNKLHLNNSNTAPPRPGSLSDLAVEKAIPGTSSPRL